MHLKPTATATVLKGSWDNGKDFLQAFVSTKSMTVNQAVVPGLETSHP